MLVGIIALGRVPSLKTRAKGLEGGKATVSRFLFFLLQLVQGDVIEWEVLGMIVQERRNGPI